MIQMQDGRVARVHSTRAEIEALAQGGAYGHGPVEAPRPAPRPAMPARLPAGAFVPQPAAD
ncbi:MAG: hypothetical protein JNK29_19515 [Anaerolineales bacterium]|nr:hypothetical protein [Anaerolineales bacterium]